MRIQYNVRKNQAFRPGGENEGEFLVYFVGYNGRKAKFFFSARAFGARVASVYFCAVDAPKKVQFLSPDFGDDWFCVRTYSATFVRPQVVV